MRKWRTIALAVAMLLPGAAVFGASERPEQLEWIDAHVHLLGRRGEPQDYWAAAQAALAVMKEAGITKMVVMPPPQVYGNPSPDEYQTFVGALKRPAGRFAFLGGGGSLNAMLQEAGQKADVDDRSRRRFEETALDILRDGARGFGELAAHHLSLEPGHPYESVAADHPLLLLLADIAARHDVPIDLHFDVVTEDMKAPEWLASPPNPASLRANVAAFERLLAHNRNARIVWAHAGSDMLGHRTTELSRALLERHPNLYMSLRMAPARAPQNYPLNAANAIKPDWRRLLEEYPDRFVIGGDQFIAAPSLRGGGPGLRFAERAPMNRARTKVFLEALPPDLARKIASETAVRLYKLKD